MGSSSSRKNSEHGTVSTYGRSVIMSTIVSRAFFMEQKQNTLKRRKVHKGDSIREIDDHNRVDQPRSNTKDNRNEGTIQNYGN